VQQRRENKRHADGARRQEEQENSQVRESSQGADWPGVPNRHAAASQDSLLPLLLVVMVSRPKGSSLLMGSLQDK
jgi:hypothetical protein